jgi:hypothetical protein
MREATQTIRRLNELAADIGRLRRRYGPDHILERAACHVQTLSLMIEPTAGELVAWTAPGDSDAVIEAIKIKDDRHRRLLFLLGEAA